MFYNLKDYIQDAFDHLNKNSMNIVEYKACSHALSRYLAVGIYTKFERIKKFINGLEGPYQLDNTYVVILMAYF